MGSVEPTEMLAASGEVSSILLPTTHGDPTTAANVNWAHDFWTA